MPARRSASLCSALVLAAALLAGCGRALPEDEAGPAGGDQAGALELEELEGAIKVEGVAALAPFVEAAGRGFKAEEPSVTVAVGEGGAERGVELLCAVKVDAAATDRRLTQAQRAACDEQAGGAVELHLANGGGKPLYLVTSIEALQRFEVEAFVQYVIDNAEQLAQEAKLEPVSVDELQEAQTTFEQALAGIG